MELVECKNLCKKFDEKQILENINLTIPKGKIIGLLGKNGTGIPSARPHPKRKAKTTAHYKSRLRKPTHAVLRQVQQPFWTRPS